MTDNTNKPKNEDELERIFAENLNYYSVNAKKRTAPTRVLWVVLILCISAICVLVIAQINTRNEYNKILAQRDSLRVMLQTETEARGEFGFTYGFQAGYLVGREAARTGNYLSTEEREEFAAFLVEKHSISGGYITLTKLVYIVPSRDIYHIKGDCSNMSNPQAVTFISAYLEGRTPCKKCANEWIAKSPSYTKSFSEWAKENGLGDYIKETPSKTEKWQSPQKSFSEWAKENGLGEYIQKTP